MNAITEVGFDYSTIEVIARDDVRDAAVRIRVRMQRTAQDIIEIGKDLIAVKEVLGHGHFLSWIEAEFGMSERTAYRFTNVAERLASKLATVATFTPSILYELAAPGTPDEVVEAVVHKAAEGDNVSRDEIKELKKQLAEQRDKVRDAKATERDVLTQLDEIRKEAEQLRQGQKVQAAEEKHGRSNPVSPAADALNDIEVVERQVDALMAAWNRAGREAREEFMTRIDRPIFDQTRAAS